jgi:hypothetical protein
MLLLSYRVFSRLMYKVINLGLLLLDFVPGHPVLLNMKISLLLVHELLVDPGNVEGIPIFVFYVFHGRIVILFDMHLLQLKFVHILYKPGPIRSVSDPLGCLLFLFSKLDDPGFNLNLLLLSRLEALNCFYHRILWHVLRCAQTSLKVRESIHLNIVKPAVSLSQAKWSSRLYFISGNETFLDEV